MLSKSRNVMRYLKTQYQVLRLRQRYEQALRDHVMAQSRLTGGQLGEAQRLIPQITSAVLHGVNPFKRKETA